MRYMNFAGTQNGRCCGAAEETGHSMVMLLSGGFGFRPVVQSERVSAKTSAV